MSVQSKMKNKSIIKSVAFIMVVVILLTSAVSVFGNVSSSTEKETNQNSLEGKYISFLGDSITTYEGYSNNTLYNTSIGSNSVWYNSSKLLTVEDTYWHMVTENLGMKLCVNNSFSGSEVTVGAGQASAKRCQNLHKNVEKIIPDIIVVYIGINDHNRNNTLGSFDGVSTIYDGTNYIGNLDEFADAYATMVHKMKKAYPKADIYLCNFVQYNTTTIPQWNSVISQIATAFDCTVVDFYNKTAITSANKAMYLLDSVHPNKNGMKEMAAVLEARILKNYD